MITDCMDRTTARAALAPLAGLARAPARPPIRPSVRAPAGPVGFLGADAVAQLIARHGVGASIADIADRIEADFLRWPAFDKSARVACRSPGGVIELMPVADDTTWSFKYVNGHPGNRRHGLPTVMAFGALARMADGRPELLAELALATALRTAAMSALAARHLARPDSRVMALIGNGSQSEFQAIAFHRLLGIRALRVFDVDPAATAKLVRNLAASAETTGLDVTTCDSAAAACAGADIVTTVTATQARVAVLTPDMIRPGMHLNAVGGDSPGKTELDPAVVDGSDVFVEFEPQTRVEGEIQQMAPDFPVTEFWRVLAGDRPGRVSPTRVTLFDSVGFALEDLSTLRFLQDAGQALGLIRPLDLLPALSDPRDLFGSLAAASARASR